MQIAQKDEAWIQLTYEEFDLMAVADRSAEVHLSKKIYDNDIFMFIQEEQYTKLLEPILEPHQVPQNDSNVIFDVSNVEQGGGKVEQHPGNAEETRALYDSLYNNLAIEVENVNTINRKLRATNAELTIELKAKVKDYEYYKIKILLAKKDKDEQVLLAEDQAWMESSSDSDQEIRRNFTYLVSQDIISVVQNAFLVHTSDLQTELERTKKRFENCIIKKETEYAKLWNDWTKPIIVSQPHVITKNDMKSKRNGFSSTDVKSTTRARRPLCRNNPKNDKAPSNSKSSQLLNNLEKIEESHRNLQSS
nr:hypothetical protein [Tanacetum cinerariifolium]